MKTAQRLGASSVVYAVSLIVTFAALCYSGNRQCEIGRNLTLGETAIPLLFVFGGLVLLGLVVAAPTLVADSTLPKRYTVFGIMIRVLVGTVIGILPMVVWYVVVSGFVGAFYPRMDYLPFAIGGMLGAIACLLTAPKMQV